MPTALPSGTEAPPAPTDSKCESDGCHHHENYLNEFDDLYEE